MEANDREKKIYRITIIGSIGNFALMTFKFIAGILGHSPAMIADSVHSISDFITDVIVLLFVKISSKPRDVDHQYGHGKFETLAASIIGLMLMGVGAGLLWSGVVKIWDFAHGQVLNAPGMIALIAAAVSIVIKEGLYHYTLYVGKKTESQSVIANAWHHRSDAFSSIATSLGIGGAIMLGGKWSVLDPIAAVLVSILIIKVAISLFVPSINELLEKSLPKETENEIRKAVDEFPEVSDIHNLRTRRIGPVTSIEFHIRMDGNMSVTAAHNITRKIESRLKDILGPETIINIHVEPKK